MSLLFNRLSRLVITFLPRRKCLLISWLQSPPAVILEPKKKKKYVTISTVSPSICKEHKLTPRSTAEAEKREDLSAQPCARVSSQPWVIEGHPAPPRAGQGRRARSIKLKKRTAWALRAPKLLKRGAQRDIDAKPKTHRPRWAGGAQGHRSRRKPRGSARGPARGPEELGNAETYGRSTCPLICLIIAS